MMDIGLLESFTINSLCILLTNISPRASENFVSVVHVFGAIFGKLFWALESSKNSFIFFVESRKVCEPHFNSSSNPFSPELGFKEIKN